MENCVTYPSGDKSFRTHGSFVFSRFVPSHFIRPIPLLIKYVSRKVGFLLLLKTKGAFTINVNKVTSVSSRRFIMVLGPSGVQFGL